MTDAPGGQDDVLLRVRDAAWLARVNDGTIREWTRGGSWPGKSVDEVQDAKVRWADLAAFCATNKKALLPLHALRLGPDDFDAEGGLGRAVRAAQERLSGAEAEIERLTVDVRGLRLALRERLDGLTHARADAAAADRSLKHLLDADEEKSKIRG